MAKIKLNLKSLSVLEMVAKARQMATALTGNPNYPNAQAVVTRMTTAADAAETAHADVQAARQDALTKTSISREMTDALAGAMRQVAAHIESVAGDDVSKILSGGVDIKSTTPSTPSSDSPPAGLHATAGDHEGEIDLSWDTLKGAKSYVIERSADPPTATSWAHETVTTKSSTTIDGLSSGTRYWFRVAAVTSAGQSGWSDPAVKMAP